jgi:hypothetical protein
MPPEPPPTRAPEASPSCAVVAAWEAESVKVLRALLWCEKEQVQCAAARALLDYAAKQRARLREEAAPATDRDPAEMTEAEMAQAFLALQGIEARDGSG